MTLSTLLDWFELLADRFEERSGSMPIVLRGTDPLEDIESVRQTGFGRIYWFWYPKNQYSEKYWDLISLKHINSQDITCFVSNSEFISEQLDMTDELESIPNLWLMNIESQVFIDK